MITALRAKAGPYARAISHLRPAQVAHHLRLRAQRRIVARRPEHFARRWAFAPTGEPGLPEGFRALDDHLVPNCGDLADIEAGAFTFLAERRSLTTASGELVWDPADASQLWLFHHHYWEWAWTLAHHPDRELARQVFAQQWRSWNASTTLGRWNAWAAYPVALRSWVLVNVFDRLVAGSDLHEQMVADLGLHCGFLAHNLELDLGGNHLIKDLKALYGLGVFLERNDVVARAESVLIEELNIQVLTDGGHFELSPTYHCQVLGDLIDIATLLRASDRDVATQLSDAITRMRNWLGAIRMPDGLLPRFNDTDQISIERIDALRPSPTPTQALTVLPHSGHVIARRGPFHLVCDVGQPGEPSLPGHIHADTLTFELAVEGARVIVDAGTSEYGSGPRRQHERSTRSHNTVEIDRTNQTEVWGAFRAGHMARATLESATDHADRTEIIASHSGYERLSGSPTHRRTWLLSETSLAITDEIVGTGDHHVAVNLLLTPEAPIEVSFRSDLADAAASSAGTTGNHADQTKAFRLSKSEAFYATGFGILERAVAWSATAQVALPQRFRTTIASRKPERGRSQK